MKTENYLADLKRQQQLLIDGLKYMGIDTADNELFNDLIPKVLDINELRRVKTGTGYATPSGTTFVPSISFDIGFEPEKLYVFSPNIYEETSFTTDGSPTFLYAIYYDFNVPTDNDYCIYYFGRHDQQLVDNDTNGIRAGRTKKKSIGNIFSYNNGTATITLSQSLYDNMEFTFKEDKPYNFIAIGKPSVAENLDIFDITNDGVLNLKEEYKPDGSEYNNLPAFIVIPTEVGGITVSSFAESMFYKNNKIEVVVLPDTISNIPKQCFHHAHSLRSILNTKNITSVGYAAFANTRLKTIDLQNLSANGLSDYAFRGSAYLETINIGNNITSLDEYSLARCTNLHTIFGGKKITAIGKSALFGSRNLKDIGGILSNSGLSVIGTMAFYDTGYGENAWGEIIEKLPENIFADYSTPFHQSNYAEWLTYQTGNLSNVINPIPIKFCQDEPQWANKKLGEEINTYIEENNLMAEKINVTDETITYGSACTFWVLFSAFCGKKIKEGAEESNYTFTNPSDLVIRMWIDANELGNGAIFKKALEEYSLADMYTALNLSYINHYHCEANDIEAFYNALKQGKYIQLKTQSGVTGVNASTHSVLVCGVKADGKILISNTSSPYGQIGDYKFEITECYPQNILIDVGTTATSGFADRLFTIID